jgi:hypothetical protein
MTLDQLMESWKSMINSFTPCREQFALWLCTHDDDTVRYGIRETAKKFLRDGKMTDDHLVRYASAVMNNRTQ